MNYMMLNGRKIDLTDEQVKEMKQSFGIDKIQLANVKVGETFKVEDYEFVVLEQSGDTAAAILKNLLYEGKQFGTNNNYKNSNVDDICNEFGKKIAKIVGKNNLVEHTVDLTSDDGLKDYGSVKRTMSLLTCEQYRRYVSILDKHKVGKWWWLATAYSTPTHDDAYWSKCVAPRGSLICNRCDYCDGVRPFCIFDSSIFVSCGD